MSFRILFWAFHRVFNLFFPARVKQKLWQSEGGFSVTSLIYELFRMFISTGSGNGQRFAGGLVDRVYWVNLAEI